MQIAKYLKSEFFIILLYSLVIFLFFFLMPWLRAETPYFFRSDEAIYFYIHREILNTGMIPTELNYIGGINNYIYPMIYMSLSTLLIIIDRTYNLLLASVVLDIILFISLLITASITYKIALFGTKSKKIAFLAGFFFSTSPIISGRLFYLHATYYANFIGISFLMLFVYYLIKYETTLEKKHLGLSIFFYAITLFTHQLVFMMATVILGINFFLNLTQKRFFNNIGEKISFVLITLFVNIGYILKTPMLQKILNILGIVKYEEFGKEVISKSSASSLPPLIPLIFLGIAVISAIIIIVRNEYKSLRTITYFFLFLTVSLLLMQLNINLPASFRYDTFFIITVPLLLSIFLIKIVTTTISKTLFVVIIIGAIFLSSSNITNSFTIEELNSVKTGLDKLACKRSVSYFRIAPWIPALSKSDIYYAHVDIYNAHQERQQEIGKMLLPSDQEESRLSLIKERGIDCLLYEKNFLRVDGIRVKGWDSSNYEDLYGLTDTYYEDDNVVIFKFSN